MHIPKGMILGVCVWICVGDKICQGVCFLTRIGGGAEEHLGMGMCMAMSTSSKTKSY